MCHFSIQKVKGRSGLGLSYIRAHVL